MIRIVLGVAAAVAVAGQAMAQNCFYDEYGQIVCMRAPQYQDQDQKQEPVIPGAVENIAGAQEQAVLPAVSRSPVKDIQRREEKPEAIAVVVHEEESRATAYASVARVSRRQIAAAGAPPAR